MTEKIDGDSLFVDEDFSFVENGLLFDAEAPLLSYSPPAEAFSNTSPESVSSWIGQIESLLMNDDDRDQQIGLDSDEQPITDFLADILVDVSGSEEKESDGSDGSRTGSPEKEITDGPILKDSNDVSDDSGNGTPEKESADREAKVNKDGEDPDDPVAKRRRRQLRNRDAAVRSRERKKMYLRDLEMKSKYMERECMRLGRLLQCFVAENQALRLCLQKGGSAYDASTAKQESAVLVWESLLLGSLLWYLGIMCLFPQPPLESIPPETVAKESENEAPRGRGSKTMYPPPLIGGKSRRCKASKTRMKPNPNGLLPCGMSPCCVVLLSSL